jgi:hypothetical protein
MKRLIAYQGNPEIKATLSVMLRDGSDALEYADEES